MKPVINTSKSLSIVWGITLAFLTLMDWNTLNQDPVSEDILTPFISRHITVLDAPPEWNGSDVPGVAALAEGKTKGVQYQVELEFNGLLFLLCFFLPPLAFHGLAHLAKRGNNNAGTP